MGFLRGLLILTIILFLFILIASIITLTVAILSLIGVAIYVLLKRDSWEHRGEDLYDGK